MKKLMVFLTVFLVAAFVATPAMAWMIDSKDHDWRGEHKFNEKTTFPTGSTVVDNATHSGTTTDSGTRTLTGTMTHTGTIDFDGATDFDYAQTRNMPLSSWLKRVYVASPNLVDGNALYASTGPNYITNNGLWTIYWNASDTASIQYPLMRVQKYTSGANIAWRALVRWTGTTTTPTSASKYMQWSLMVNTGDSTIATASTAMTRVAIPPITTASQSILTFTPNASAQASLVEGAWYSIMIGPTADNYADGRGAGDLYLIGFEQYRL